MPKGVYVRDPAKIASRTVGEPVEETRQHYANIRISLKILEFKAASEVAPFDVVLHAFRCYGAFYDAGQRLRDLQVAA
jgi:hypothetical protein